MGKRWETSIFLSLLTECLYLCLGAARITGINTTKFKNNNNKGPTNAIKQITLSASQGSRKLEVMFESYTGYDGILQGFVISLALAEICLDF